MCDMIDLIFAIFVPACLILATLTGLALRKMCTTRARYRVVSPASFPDLDLAYYERTQAQLQYLGLRHVGDVENVMHSPWLRHFDRVMISDDECTMASFCDARFRKWLRPVHWLGIVRRKAQGIELSTEFSDGTFIATIHQLCRGVVAPDGISLQLYPPSTPPAKLLASHQQAVRERLQIRPEVRVVPCSTLEESINSSQRMHDLRIADYRAKGFLRTVFSTAWPRRRR